MKGYPYKGVWRLMVSTDRHPKRWHWFRVRTNLLLTSPCGQELPWEDRGKGVRLPPVDACKVCLKILQGKEEGK